jgi:hypothetical protein
MQLRLIVLLLSIFVVTGCGRAETSQTERASATPPTSAATPSPQQTTTVAASPQAKPKLDACAMLTSEEIKSIQGEGLKETKLSQGSADGLNVSQCFFTLPTFTNSISLAVTQRADGPGARDPRQFWKETFHEGEKDRKEEEGESRPPQKISGIGDEAFWMKSRAAGILYVLKGSSYIRISIGGRGDQQAEIRKSKALAQKVIDRL